MTNTVNSINNFPVRLTDERWNHIVENHNEMAGYYYDVLETIAAPNYVLQGDRNELWAIKFISEKKCILVIYREIKYKNDGFIITSFLTTKFNKLLKRKILWKQPK